MSNPAALTQLPIPVTDISMPDVACYTDISTGDMYAAFVYVKHTGPSTTDYQTAVYSFTTNITIPYTIESNQTLGYPRIEAQSLYDPGSLNAAWMAVGSVRAGGLFETRMYDANNIGTPVSLSAPLANGLDNTLPAIAAGTGDMTTGGIGNMQYTAMLLPTTNPYAYSMPLQLSGGVFGWDYFEPNMTPLAPKLSPVIAITSCSNTGLNLMAAWFNGTDIMYKTTSNVNQYKTTSVSTVATEHVSLSPNPATDELTLTGIDNGTYSITDVTGNVVAEGSAIDKTTINIQALAPAMYILDARKGSNSTKMKFVKQ